MSTLRKAFLLSILTLGTSLALAQEALIRKNLGTRLPQVKINEVTATPIPGIFEIRINDSEILYTSSQGDYLIQGEIFDTQKRKNLTEERIEKLTAIQFNKLPFKDAFTIVRGDGSRKLALFSDPNCGYCKRFERDLQQINNVTVYVFLYPILGADSTAKAKATWCAKDRQQVWLDWMVRGQAPATAAACDTTAISNNLDWGRKFRVTGTPTLFFESGSRASGALNAQQLEQALQASKK